MIIAKNQKGIALVTSLVMTMVVMGILTVVLYKITATTKETVVVQKYNTAKNIADEGLENTVDWLNNRNSPLNYPPKNLSSSSKDPVDLLKAMTIQDFLSPVNGISDLTTLENKINNLNFDPTSLVVNPNSDKNIYYQSTNAETSFPPIIIPNVKNLETNSQSVLKQLDNSSKVYSYTNSGKNNIINGEFKIGISPMNSPNAKYDLLRVGINSYIPSYSDPNAIIKKYVAVLQRPKDVSWEFKDAILAGGNINLGNGDSQGGTSPTTLVANEGDVHTNKNLFIGANGKVNGDASATGTITNNGTITGTSTPNAPEKPIPKMDYENPFPASPVCVNVGTPNNIRYNGDCIVPNSISLSGQDTLTITGKVYVQGNYKEAGQGRITGINLNGRVPMLITSGDLETAGNASTDTSDQSMLFISTGGNMAVKGNGNITGVFVNDNPNGYVDVTGNGSIFGAIISTNDVKFSGNNATVTRNTNLTTLPTKILPTDYNMRLLSWKEIN